MDPSTSGTAERRLVDAANAVLPGAPDAVHHAVMLASHVELNDLSVVSGQRRLPGERIAESAGLSPTPQSDPVIAFCTEFEKEEQQSEIERCHLPDLTLSASTDTNQNRRIDHSRTQHDLGKHLPAGNNAALNSRLMLASRSLALERPSVC